MKKHFIFFLTLVFLIGCSGGQRGIWGRRTIGWNFKVWEGKDSGGLIKEVNSEAKLPEGYIVSLQACKVKNKEGLIINLSPGEGLKNVQGQDLQFPPSGCKVMIIPKHRVIFEGLGGEGNRKYVILFEGVYLLGHYEGDRLKFKIFPYGGKFPLPKEEVVLLQILDRNQWEKIKDEFSDVSYTGTSIVYQVIPLFPQKFMSFFTHNKKRVLFYSMVMPLPPPAGFIFPAPGYKFKIEAISKGKREVISEFFQNRGIEKRLINLPPSTTRVEFKIDGRDFGNLAFITNPYFYNPSQRTPIVVLVSMDTVRAKSLSIYGGEARTPALSRLAKESLVFDRAYTPHPWTYDGHMAALFSKYCWEKPEKALAEVVQSQGFYTAAFTGGGLVAPHLGFARGFALYSVRPYDIFDPHSSSKLFKEAKKFIEQNTDKPLFLFLHTYQAHSPYLAEGKRFDVLYAVGGLSGIFSPLSQQEREMAQRLYEDEVSIIDRDFTGPFLKFLKNSGLWKRTHLIIFADHGEQFYEHGNWEHGYSLYEEEVHVPLIVHSRKFKEGRDKSLISLINLWSLVLKITGGEPYKNWKKRRDFILLSTPKSKGGFLFPQKTAILKGDYKLIHNIFTDKKAFRHIPNLPRVELYNLRDDPSEGKNLYGSIREGISLKRALFTLEKPYLTGEGYKPTPEDLKKLRTLGYVK